MPILARTAGLIAHLGEEAETPIGFYLAAKAEEAIEHTAPIPGRSRVIEPEIESAPWEAQAAQDAPLYREQIRLSLRSARVSIRTSWPGGLSQSPKPSADSPTSRACRSRKRTNCARSRSREEPIGTHLTATRDEIVRIYSTSGTTGTPSYIPLTQGDLEVWVRTSSRSYAASGLSRGERIVSTYNAGPFVAGAALGAFDRLGPLPYPRRHGQYRAADGGGRSPRSRPSSR